MMKIYSVFALLITSVLASMVYADNGQNAAALSTAVSNAGSSFAAGNWVGAATLMVLGLYHVLAMQSMHWSHQQTLTKILTKTDPLLQQNAEEIANGLQALAPQSKTQSKTQA